MNLTVLQRISWYNFVYFSLIYVLPPNDRVLCSFVITERIPTSRPLINLTLWSIPPNKGSALFILFYFILQLCHNTKKTLQIVRGNHNSFWPITVIPK